MSEFRPKIEPLGQVYDQMLPYPKDRLEDRLGRHFKQPIAANADLDGAGLAGPLDDEPDLKPLSQSYRPHHFAQTDIKPAAEPGKAAESSSTSRFRRAGQKLIDLYLGVSTRVKNSVDINLDRAVDYYDNEDKGRQHKIIVGAVGIVALVGVGGLAYAAYRFGFSGGGGHGRNAHEYANNGGIKRVSYRVPIAPEHHSPLSVLSNHKTIGHIANKTVRAIATSRPNHVTTITAEARTGQPKVQADNPATAHIKRTIEQYGNQPNPHDPKAVSTDIREKLGHGSDGHIALTPEAARAAHVNLNNYSWDVAHQLHPGHEITAIDSALKEFNKLHNTNFKLAPHNTSLWIMNGNRAIDPVQMHELNELMLKAAV